MMSHLEVGRVNPQLEGVQVAEIAETGSQVIDLAHSQSDSTHHLLSVGLHGARAGAHVRPVGEVGLGLRVDGEHPVEVEMKRSGGYVGEPGQLRAQTNTIMT